MKKRTLTSEQKQMERDFARMTDVIKHAKKGQDFIHRQCVTLGGIDEKRQAFYDTYQSQIDAAEARIVQLKEIANERAIS